MPSGKKRKHSNPDDSTDDDSDYSNKKKTRSATKKNSSKKKKTSSGGKSTQKEKLFQKYSGMTVSQLKILLGVNELPAVGNKTDLAWRCAYGELIGSPEKCKGENRKCEGRLKVDVNPSDHGDIKKITYKCPGFFDDEEDKFKFHGKKYTADELKHRKWKTEMDVSFELPDAKSTTVDSDNDDDSTNGKPVNNSPKKKLTAKDRSEKESSLPVCPYGSSCYRKNPKHHLDYKHPPKD